jgi:regulator of cell morphogenesis and NO signaling
MATDLIDHILTRFHETHRRALPGIVAMARELERKGTMPTPADDLDVMAKALEVHRF